MQILTEQKAELFLEKEGFPVVERKLYKSFKEIKSLDFPVVLKASHDKLLHKTEKNAVKLNVTEKNLKQNYKALEKISKSILIQKQVSGTEILIGIKKDPTFGHTLLLASGGINTELINDKQIRVLPIDKKEIRKMINGLKTRQKLNKKELEKIILKVIKFAKKHKKLQELDINPLILSDKPLVVDARMIFE